MSDDLRERTPLRDQGDPLTGQATGASGGYGSGSGDGSSGGSQERTDGWRRGDGQETDWLRDAASTVEDGTVAADDVTHDEGIATKGDRGLGAQGAATE